MVQTATVARLDRLPEMVERILSKKSDLDDARADIGSLYARAEEDGFNRRALKEAIRLKQMEADKRNDYLASLQAYCDKLEVWTQGDLFGAEPEIPAAPAAAGDGGAEGDMMLRGVARQGREAGLKGAAIESNPYQLGTPAWAAWDQGWLDGQAELAANLGNGHKRRGRPRKETEAEPAEA
jgi:uncharacterized protein (UPF0335 family)